MHFFAMTLREFAKKKLQEFAKVVGSCGLMNKKKRSDSPNTLFSPGDYFNVVKSHLRTS